MTTSVIEIKQLGNWLGGQWVHKDLDLTIQAKEILGVVGGSGSGKTTLLRSILMLQTPKVGSIHIFGTDIIKATQAEVNAVRRLWGVMFQQSALFSSLNVLENVQFPLRTFTRLPPAAQQKIALLKLSLVGLPIETATKYPAELSGGMQKRVALARAIALDPELLFLDEPTAGLDPQNAEALDNLVLDLRNNLGLTVIVITHDLDTLARITDRVAFLGEGRVLAVLPLAQLAQQKQPLIDTYFSGDRCKQYRERP